MNNPLATLPDVVETHVPVGSLVTVTIGRNVPAASAVASWSNGDTQRPMNRRDWHEFQALTKLALQSFASDTFGPFTGFGEWEGVSEDCATFTAITRDPITPSELDRMLSVLAATYDQDAIAYSYGAARLARS